MCDALASFFGALARINWSEAIQAFAGLAMAYAAFRALKNWKRQDKAKRETQYLDALLDAVHTYFDEMSKPITLVEIAQLGFKSHAPTSGDNTEPIVEGAIAYIKKTAETGIEKTAETGGQRLREALEGVRPHVTRLRFLAAKGQVFGFEDFSECQNAITMLTWQFDQTNAFAALTGSSGWNWNNPEIRKNLKNVIIELKPDKMRASLEKNELIVREFFGKTYNRIYR